MVVSGLFMAVIVSCSVLCTCTTVCRDVDMYARLLNNLNSNSRIRFVQNIIRLKQCVEDCKETQLCKGLNIEQLATNKICCILHLASPNSDCATLTGGSLLFYNGTRNMTRTGLACQRWDSQFPHKHRYQDSSHFITGETMTQMGNYCRNVVGENGFLPWCYTRSQKTSWQFCVVPVCSVIDTTYGCYTIRERDGEDYIVYNGTKNTTVSGWTCQRWDKNSPHKKHVGSSPRNFLTGETMEEVANYCRVTTERHGQLLPWCYTTNPEVRWEICITKQCPSSGGRW